MIKEAVRTVFGRLLFFGQINNSFCLGRMTSCLSFSKDYSVMTLSNQIQQGIDCFFFGDLL